MACLRRALLVPLLLGGLFTIGACHSDEVMILPGEDMRVTPTSLQLIVGDSAILRAARYDRRGRPTVARFPFTSGPPMVAAVRAVNDSTAVVTALTSGQGPITVQSPLGGGTFTVPVTVIAR